MMLDVSESDGTDISPIVDQSSSVGSGPVTLLLNVNSPRMKIMNTDIKQEHTQPHCLVDLSLLHHHHHHHYISTDEHSACQPHDGHQLDTDKSVISPDVTSSE